MSDPQDRQNGKSNELMGRNPYEIKEGIIFCIELSWKMFDPDPLLDGNSQIREILESLLDTMTNLVVTLPNTGIGCYFFNVDTEEERKNIDIFLPLLDLNADSVKLVNDVLEDDRIGRKSLVERFPPVKDDGQKRTSLFDILNEIQDVFFYNNSNNSKRKSYNIRKIFLFTDNDKPFHQNYRLKLTLRKILSDFDDAFISIVPFFINNYEFDVSEYQQILFQDVQSNNDEERECENFDKPIVSTVSPNNIKSKVERVKEVKRIAFNCPLELAPELKISIKGYSIYTHEKVSPAVKVVNEGESFNIVESKQVILDERTSEEISFKGEENDHSSSKVLNKKVFQFGNDDYIPLSVEQLSRIKKIGEVSSEPMLRIIGFRSFANHYMLHYNIRNSSFLVPDNNGNYTHSQRTFSCLFQSLNISKKYAIVWGYNRVNSPASLFSMIPSSLYSNQKISFPDGFFLIRLPFKDDIRQLPNNLKPQPCSIELTSLCERILKKLYIKDQYLSRDYPNPMINWHFERLRDEICQIESDLNLWTSEGELRQEILNESDNTKKKILNVRNYILSSMPENKQLGRQVIDETTANNISELIKTFNSMLNKLTNYEDQYIKKHKPEANNVKQLTDKEILVNYKNNSLNSFKANELKNYIKNKNITCQGTKKQDYIDGIIAFLRTKDINMRQED